MPEGLFYPGAILSLHRKAADRLLGEGNADAALLYLCLLAEKDAAVLQWPADRLEAAHRTLITLELTDPAQPVTTPPAQKLEDDRPPDYTTQDIAHALAHDRAFASLLKEAERMLGKVFSYKDQTGLYLLLDFYGLPPEVILTLIRWCMEKTVKRYGEGRKPTLPQIKREAHKWYEAGVNTLDAADAYLRRQQQLGTRGVEILALLDIRGRSPVGREEEYLEVWIQRGYPDEVIRLAFERTLFQTGKLRWSYLNGILNSWHQQGLTTLEAIEAAEKRGKPRFTAPRPPRPNSPETPALATDDLAHFFKEG